MKKSDVMAFLERHGACSAAQEWFAAQPGTVKSMYLSCPDSDWLDWLCYRIELSAEWTLMEVPLWEKYERVSDAAQIVYDREKLSDQPAASSKYDKATDAAWEEHEAACQLPWAMVRDALNIYMEG